MIKSKKVKYALASLLIVVMIFALVVSGISMAHSEQINVFATAGYDADAGTYTDPNGNVLEVRIDDLVVQPYFDLNSACGVVDEVIFPRPEDLGVDSYMIGADFFYCLSLETIYIPDGNITVDIGAFGYEIGQYSKLSQELQDAYENSGLEFPGNTDISELTKLKNVFIGGSGVRFEILDGLGDCETMDTVNGKMVPFFGIVNPYLGDCGWIPDDFLTKVAQAGCRIYMNSAENLPECYSYYSSIIETSTVVGTEVSVLSKMAEYEATYQTATSQVLPHTGVVLNVVFPSTIIGFVALAWVVASKKKEQF